MSTLIKRYLSQVGYYLPADEREDVQNELRSLIQDQLDDRYGAAPNEEAVATVLKEFGSPYKVATSYTEHPYLIGPQLYPYFRVVLRYILLIVPPVTGIINVLGIIGMDEEFKLIQWLLQLGFDIIGNLILYSGIAVIIFAILERSNVNLDEHFGDFNPHDLPAEDDPRYVDRMELGFGVIISGLMLAGLAYVWHLGGLPSRLNFLEDHGEIIDVPQNWLYFLMGTLLGMMLFAAYLWQRKYWNLWRLGVYTLLELGLMLGTYFVVIEPLYTPVLDAIPQLKDLVPVRNGPVAVAAVFFTYNIFQTAYRFINIWNYRQEKA